MLSRSQSVPPCARGFSLIEMMVALAIGLIVIGAVLGLVLSIIRSNNQTIQATRLTQELRAIAAVIASDIKRSSGVDDPMTVATASVTGTALNPFAAIDGATAGCIRYAYANAPGGNFHAVSLSNGAVFLDAGDALADATCGGGERLSSRFLAIDALTFVVAGRRIDITLRGSLVNDATIQRTFAQTVFVRSVAGS